MLHPTTLRPRHVRALLHSMTTVLCSLLLSTGMAQLPGNIDPTFNPTDPGFGIGDGVSGETSTIYSQAEQADGKILIGGDFTQYNGQSRPRIARLEANGQLDATFDPGAGANGSIRTMQYLPDGKIMIAGDFTTYGGVARSRIARLNANGTLDTSFDPSAGADQEVRAPAVQPDGKVLIGGSFTTVGGVPRSRIARLNEDGSVDASFVVGTGVNDRVEAIGVQPDGKIVFGGNFNFYNGVQRNRLCRLNADGSLDTSFAIGTGPSSAVYVLKLLPDGRILIGGVFTSYNGTIRNRIARVNTNGSLDTSFDPGTGLDLQVNSVTVQSDGRVLLAGRFTMVNGAGKRFVARLESDGAVDMGFDIGSGVTNGTEVFDVTPLNDGRILACGSFVHFNGRYVRNLVALQAGGAVDTGFNPSMGVLTDGLQSLVALPDGRTLIGGAMVGYNGIAIGGVARVHADGSLDESFQPGSGTNSLVEKLRMQPDGKILVVGAFPTFDGATVGRIVRLFADGAS